MTGNRNRITRRAVLAGIGGLAAASQVAHLTGRPHEAAAQTDQSMDPFNKQFPINGKAGPGLKEFDSAMLKVMDRHGVPGAALAITRNGKLVLAKGYGWANVTTGAPIQPDTLFGLASLSKTITAVAILKLVEQEKLRLDDPVLKYLAHIRTPRGARMDGRLREVTIRQCLNHSGGWDRAVTGDPVNWEPQICRAFRLRPPLSPIQFISFALTLPLNFKPGTDAKYSNVGYILLGEVIARVAEKSYEQYVAEHILNPMGIKRARVHASNGTYLKGEAIRYLAGTLIALPAMRLPMVNATGGWSGSVVDLARFLTNLEGVRGEPVLKEKTWQSMLEVPPKPLQPRQDGTYFGLGWDSVLVKGTAFGYFKDGSYQGMRTFMKRLPTGVSWVLLYNASMEFDPQDMAMVSNTVHHVRQIVESFEKYPDVDLFKEFP
jgi:N-acyl-D-amino-acid deacylase